MAKVLTDRELASIIDDAINKDLIDCADSYEHFLEDLSQLISKHFGGTVHKIGKPDETMGWTTSFQVDENVPPDGGVFRDYDRDVVWLDGKETNNGTIE
ncbi:MAG: hypothetical protein WBK76_00430 [Candidatus Saccharimonadales bacterium]